MKVFITGISKGIGKALAREMVANGHTVWGVARNVEELQQLQNELGKEHLKYSIADLSSLVQVQALVSELERAEFYPEQVYLNAGLYSTADSTFTSIEHAEQLLLTNMHAPIWLYKGFMQLATPPKGFVLISSLFALLTDAVNPAYVASKAGVSAAFKAFALQSTAPHIQIVYLGPVNTDVNEHSGSEGSAMLADPVVVAKFLAQIYKRGKQQFIYPFTAWGFYQVFRFLPISFYNWVMVRLRR